MKTCSVDGCESKHYCKSFCSKHYQAFFKYGDPLYNSFHQPMLWIKKHAAYEGSDCIQWPFSRLTNGYGMVNTGDGKKRIASRVMCETAHGEPPCESMQAAHSCGNGHMGCMNPSHLRWATVKENHADKLAHGTHLYGEKAPWSILSESDAKYVLESSEGPTALAKKFGVSKWTIYAVRQRKNWKHIDG